MTTVTLKFLTPYEYIFSAVERTNCLLSVPCLTYGIFVHDQTRKPLHNI